MQKQMLPSPEVRSALSEKLAQAPKKRPVSWVKYGAVAACAVLAVGVLGASQYPSWEHILQNLRPSIVETKLHSYVTVEGLTEIMPENASTTETGGGEGGDRDMGMTPQDLEQAMLDVGYIQEEINEYQSIGYQMTWANWWKFVHQQENSEGDDPFNLDDLKLFSQKELYVRTGALPAPNTGDLPGGAYIGDAPSQEEALNAYEELMDRFNGVYPDWYGGAYIDSSGWLVVQLVEDKDPADKSLELQVLDWTGSDQVMFSSCKYSLAHLKELMDRLNALPGQDMKFRDVMAGWGIDEEANRIELTLTQVYDPLLVVLAELDSDDDAIYVQVGQRATADVGTEDPAVHHVMPGGVPVPDDEDLAAVEPCYVEELPGKLPKEE